MNKQITKSSKIYAQSLFEIATENDCVDLYKNQLAQVIEIIDNSNDLKIVSENSAISVAKKIEIISAIFENKIDNKLLSFLKILIEKNRFTELSAIEKYYDILRNDKLNLKNVEIISAITPDENTKENIVSKLEEKLKLKVEPQWTTDEEIIAGLIFKYDDVVFDSSIKTKIENLAKEISR